MTRGAGLRRLAVLRVALAMSLVLAGSGAFCASAAQLKPKRAYGWLAGVIHFVGGLRIPPIRTRLTKVGCMSFPSVAGRVPHARSKWAGLQDQGAEGRL
jgi:uncharacterized membrane protein YphA (DoxX/SURF4 family)